MKTEKSEPYYEKEENKTNGEVVCKEFGCSEKLSYRDQLYSDKCKKHRFSTAKKDMQNQWLSFKQPKIVN